MERHHGQDGQCAQTVDAGNVSLALDGSIRERVHGVVLVRGCPRGALGQKYPNADPGARGRARRPGGAGVEPHARAGGAW
jgi:hypothetical protein